MEEVGSILDEAVVDDTLTDALMKLVESCGMPTNTLTGVVVKLAESSGLPTVDEDNRLTGIVLKLVEI